MDIDLAQKRNGCYRKVARNAKTIASLSLLEGTVSRLVRHSR